MWGPAVIHRLRSASALLAFLAPASLRTIPAAARLSACAGKDADERTEWYWSRTCARLLQVRDVVASNSSVAALASAVSDVRVAGQRGRDGGKPDANGQHYKIWSVSA